LARFTGQSRSGAYAMAFTTGEEEPLFNGSLNTKSTSLVSIIADMEDQHELVTTPASSQNIGAEEKSMSRRVNRKMDTALLPFLSLLYLFNGLDRSNVGNAETQGTPNLRLLIVNGDHNHPAGFTTDIGATPDDLNMAISLFFITFVLFQPPSAAVGRWLGAKHWIAIIMVSPQVKPSKCWTLTDYTDRMGSLHARPCLHSRSECAHCCQTHDRCLRSGLLSHSRRISFHLLLPI
jgi:hypothetical protein